MVVTWKFTPSGVNASNTSQAFPFALVRTPVGSRVTADASVPAATYAGYRIAANMGQTLGNSNPFQLTEWAGGSNNFLSTSAAWVAESPNVNGGTSGNHGFDSGTLYTMVWTMTRNAGPDTIGGNGDDTLTIDVTMSGGTLNGTGSEHVNFEDPTPSSFSYDMLGFRPTLATSTATSFDTTLFKVEGPLPVPEPCSLGVFGFACMIGRRRRCRR
jgi:hypothetical protein